MLVGEMRKKNKYSINLRMLIGQDLAYMEKEDLLSLFKNLLLRARDQDDFIEILYAMCEVGSAKFRILVRGLRNILERHIRLMGLDRMKMVLLYVSRTSPGCFKALLDQFGDIIHDILVDGHFNDIIILILNMSILNEESAIMFVDAMRDTIRELAMTEGFKHFGTVLWYITIMKKPNVAKKLFSVLLDIISGKTSSLTDLADMLFWLVKGDENLGVYGAELLKDRILSLLEKASIPDIAGFLLITSKHEKLFNKIWGIINPQLARILDRGDLRDRLQALLSTLKVEIPLKDIQRSLPYQHTGK